jgi:hypothetical protein
MIITEMSYSPRYRGSQTDANGHLKVTEFSPPWNDISRWSDMAFLGWQHFTQAADTPIQDLNLILISVVRNDNAEQTLRDYMQAYDARPAWGWPGFTLHPGTFAMHTFMGTPTGSGPGWLLAQHKAQLGVKRIRKLRVMFPHAQDDRPSSSDWLFSIGSA